MSAVLDISPWRPSFRESMRRWDRLESAEDVFVQSDLVPGGQLHISMGTLTDGASIPWWLWWITWLVGDPFHPLFRLGTFIHDYLYAKRIGNQRDADKLMRIVILQKCKRIKVWHKRLLWEARAWMMWFALRVAGFLWWRT